MKLTLVFMAAAMLVGCARRPAAADLVVPAGCVKRLVMRNCDLKAAQPRCEKVFVEYKSGCELLKAHANH